MTSEPEKPWVTVVGVLANVKHNSVTDVVKEKFYRPHSQWHRSLGWSVRAMTLVLRTDGDPLALVGPTKAAIARLDPNLPVTAVRPMTAVVDAALAAPRFIGLLLTSFAVLALLLAASGVYGVLAYVVSRRTREIGIRLAIGARRVTVLRMIVADGLALALAGTALGMLIGASLAPVLGAMLHGVQPSDPLTLLTAGALLVVVAAVASLFPALRAISVDPVVTLRAD
jgi:putative ABC transport system permease protein